MKADKLARFVHLTVSHESADGEEQKEQNEIYEKAFFMEFFY